MTGSRKEEILLATLELAAEKGLDNVSTSMIAERVGIKKPSLYNHFSSKEEIVKAMYQYLRASANPFAADGPVDYARLFQGKTALEVLTLVVNNYRSMNRDAHLLRLYKVIYSERTREPVAAQILVEETERMILATKQLFYALQVHGLLHFRDPDMSAVTFALTIHGLMDYENDLAGGERGGHSEERAARLLTEYLQWFCAENAAKGAAQ